MIKLASEGWVADNKIMMVALRPAVDWSEI